MWGVARMPFFIESWQHARWRGKASLHEMLLWTAVFSRVFGREWWRGSLLWILCETSSFGQKPWTWEIAFWGCCPMHDLKHDPVGSALALQLHFWRSHDFSTKQLSLADLQIDIFYRWSARLENSLQVNPCQWGRDKSAAGYLSDGFSVCKHLELHSYFVCNPITMSQKKIDTENTPWAHGLDGQSEACTDLTHRLTC